MFAVKRKMVISNINCSIISILEAYECMVTEYNHEVK